MQKPAYAGFYIGVRDILAFFSPLTNNRAQEKPG
jgi:hypothetical protein